MSWLPVKLWHTTSSISFRVFLKTSLSWSIIYLCICCWYWCSARFWSIMARSICITMGWSRSESHSSSGGRSRAKSNTSAISSSAPWLWCCHLSCSLLCTQPFQLYPSRLHHCLETLRYSLYSDVLHPLFLLPHLSLTDLLHLCPLVRSALLRLRLCEPSRWIRSLRWYNSEPLTDQLLGLQFEEYLLIEHLVDLLTILIADR